MSAISNPGSVLQTTENATTTAPSDNFNNLDIDEFLQLLITEMQNQDPLDPMDNSEMLQQIGQIREIGATDQLTSTLDNLASSQELVTASGLIGRRIEALADDTTDITGIVDRVTVESATDSGGTRKVKVHIGNKTIDIRNIREILTE